MIHLGAASVALLVLAGFAASGINAVAGGGSLVSFPALLAAGYSPIVANVSNTIALLPGYVGSSGASAAVLAVQRARIAALVPAGAAGSVLGAFLLTRTSPGAFRGVVPWLIIVACLLLAAQPRLASRLQRTAGGHERLAHMVAVQLAAGVYGGFFGAGLGVMLLATFGLLLTGTLGELNALKQVQSLVITVAAAAWFVAFAAVAWPAVGVVAAGSALGGVAGVLVARRLHPEALRLAVVAFGVGIAIRLLV